MNKSLHLQGYQRYRRESDVVNRAYVRCETEEQLGRACVASSRRQKCFNIFLNQQTVWLAAKLIQNDLYKIVDYSLVTGVDR